MDFVLSYVITNECEKKDTNMAEQQDGGLSDLDIAHLSATLSFPKMKSIAIGYMGFDVEQTISIQDRHRGNAKASNFDILTTWRDRDPNSHTKQV